MLVFLKYITNNFPCLTSKTVLATEGQSYLFITTKQRHKSAMRPDTSVPSWDRSTITVVLRAKELSGKVQCLVFELFVSHPTHQYS